VDETLKTRIKAHLDQEPPRHWRSLEERELTAEARAAGWHEFAPGASEPMEVPEEGLSRRRFLGLVGATAALAATAACSKVERGTIVPYTKRPVEVIPGVANYYASAFSEGSRVYSVLVKTREGRPIHLTGNDENPASLGKTSPRAMADILRLYDADRLRAPRMNDLPASWDSIATVMMKTLGAAKRNGRPVLLMTGAVPSPSRRAVIADFKEFLPTLEHVAWEPVEGLSQQAAVASYGAAVGISPKVDRAKVILSFGADILNGEDPLAIAGFAAGRRPSKPGEPMNRLWVFEGAMSLTGASADHRVPLKPSKLAAAAFALARDLNATHGVALPPGVDGAALPARPAEVPESLWKALLADLKAAGKTSLVLCGAQMPTEAHQAVHLLNEMLGTRGTTLDVTPAEKLASPADLMALTQGMASGKYDLVILWGVNPAYANVGGAAFAAALGKVPTSAWIGVLPDETAALCKIQISENHWLESWGDYDCGAGTVALQQPAVGTIYDTAQGEEVLLHWMKTLGSLLPADYHAYLKDRWQEKVYSAGTPVAFERYFEAALHDGYVQLPAAAPSALAFQGGAVKEAASRAAAAGGSGFELLLQPSATVYDGRYANNGWLQELPDPVTKVTWCNPVSVSVADAQKLGVTDGDHVKVSLGSASVEVPVVRQPGQAEGVLVLALGYGRTVGSVASGVGVNAYPFLDASGASSAVRSSAQVTRTLVSAALPITQGHHKMEGRDIVRTLTLAEYAQEAGKAEKKEELITLYPEQQFPDHKWGMAIDLSACVGCSGCVVACQSENNVPVVGPEQVTKGREMHWIRIDRYYEGDPANPKVAHQPMLCQQCDDAPCENVCPVNATNHSPDGLNQMVYNRCVGTRYCANNCPYKVRRFNFLEFTAFEKQPETLVHNPEVTVRPRGVMEKCTFCVQRINDARVRAKGEKRPLRDGEIVPACAAACPAEAIVFGDLKDPKSRVSELSRSDRGYKVLAELGIRPAITYLAGLKNPAEGGTHEG
jgi:MoCo/4Fe-4S cofactor protein with predicted Tat translocation signal